MIWNNLQQKLKASNNYTYSIIQYNVENFFHPQRDSNFKDEDFTPQGKYKWNAKKYYDKRDKICKVICNIAQWQNPLLVSLCEIENEQCVTDICKKLKSFNYKYIHHESLDQRGIDVAMLYDKTRFTILCEETISGKINDYYYTRDVLLIKGYTNKKDTFFVFACHLPSKLSGEKETQNRRDIMLKKIQNKVDSIIDCETNAKIIVIGDMNDKPKDKLKNLKNITVNEKNTGTYKYKGKWEMLDQIYVSIFLEDKVEYKIYKPKWLLEKDYKFLGDKPKRTFIGYKYNKDGYSDHLPVVLYIK